MGEKIKAIRKSRGMTQKEVADALGLDQSAVALWELGRTEPSTHNLRRLADILGCSPGDFF